MTTPHRGVKVLLAACALALLSGCVAVVSGGRPHFHGTHHHHFHDHGPKWRHASPWFGHPRWFHGHGHHPRRFHHHRRHRH